MMTESRFSERTGPRVRGPIRQSAQANRLHPEVHKAGRAAWLRAAVLGANDGVISVASLVAGVAASGAPAKTILVTGVAGLAAGAMSMAAGEYVSVQSQADTEQADIALEKHELESQPERELAELTGIYMRRGLDRSLAEQVAERLTSADALGTHARDELGITEALRARPVQAALASAASFFSGAVIPLAAVSLAPPERMELALAVTSLLTLALLGCMAALAGGASMIRGALRVMFWGSLAMILTTTIGRLFSATT